MQHFPYLFTLSRRNASGLEQVIAETDRILRFSWFTAAVY
jgi:hypothetical protein